ncbi:MAG: glutathione peroxidase [Saprospiraceae bacterium]|jgi:glutathione peroxidase|nr:glutathione peroxidase [Saprospiraceae bacterium]
MSDSLFNVSIQTLQGKPLDWTSFHHKKILIVNVASECGYTRQYAQLQDLYETKQEKLMILGCPCNDFGGQEPGDAVKIEEFCTLNFGVTFPLTEKINIVNHTHPLYAWLIHEAKNKNEEDIVSWNFHKFLINEDGSFYKSLPSASDPFCNEIIEWLEK